MVHGALLKAAGHAGLVARTFTAADIMPPLADYLSDDDEPMLGGSSVPDSDSDSDGGSACVCS